MYKMKGSYWQALGTRLSEETHLKPKPMVEIGEGQYCGIL